MGTRGLFGIKVNDEYYLSFSSHDSYPSGLGFWWYEYLSKVDLEKLKEKVLSSINVVFKEGSINKEVKEFLMKEGLTEEEAKKEIEIWDIGVVKNPFHSLLEDETKVYFNDKEFMKDSLFCEYTYYYDYDKQRFYCDTGKIRRCLELGNTKLFEEMFVLTNS